MLMDKNAALERASRHFWYRIARTAPTNRMRSHALNRMSFVRVGQDCYIGPGITVTPFGNIVEEPYLLSIADRADVSPNVTFLCSMTPEKTRLGKRYGRREPITVEKDAWIGADTTILAGVTIGECSVVGAGAVVIEDVEPYTVVGGVPAKELDTIDESDLHDER